MITEMDTEYLYKDLTYKIIGCLYEVHKELGSVHKEIIYHKALALELKNRNISFTEEKAIDVRSLLSKLAITVSFPQSFSGNPRR